MLEEYNGHIFEDWKTTCSNDYKSFSRKFKNRLKKAGFEVLNHQTGHYDLSGYVREKDVYIYYSYNNRYNPVDITANDAINGVLIRYAASDTDYRGEFNNFTSLIDLTSDLKMMLNRRLRQLD